MAISAVSARRMPAERSPLRSSSALRSRSIHDRVLALQRTAGNRAVAQLARQPTAESDAPTLPRLTIPDLRLPLPKPCVPERTVQSAEAVKDDPESRKLKLDDGSIWLVKRERRITFSDRFIPQPSRLSFEHDADRVWAELDWCMGSHGNIQLGANPQEAGNAAIKAIEDTIKERRHRGSRRSMPRRRPTSPRSSTSTSASRARGTCRARSRSRSTARGTAARRAASTPTSAPSTSSPPWHGRREQGLAHRRRRLDRRLAPRRHLQARAELYARQTTQYRWTPWIPEHEDPIELPYSYDFPTDYYLYFEYAKKTVNKKLSAAPRAALLEELRGGGRVTSITAHTSPEGSHAARGKWQGNVKLAEERAAAAEEWVRAVIAEAGNGSIDAKAKVESAGEAELYTLRDEQGKDIEGRDLEQHSEAMSASPTRRTGTATRSTRSSRRARSAAAAARRRCTSACAAPTSRSRATRAASSPGPRRSRASGRTSRLLSPGLRGGDRQALPPVQPLRMSETPYSACPLRRDALAVGRVREPRPPRPRPLRLRGQRHEPSAGLRDEGARREARAVRRSSTSALAGAGAVLVGEARGSSLDPESAVRVSPGTSRVLASGPRACAC